MRAIFISYRRDDAEGQAGRLFDDLVAHFGSDSVFMDVVGLEPGRDFRRAIDQQVASCGVLLALIGKNWLDARDESGKRRLDDPMDFVRLETAFALKRDIPVVPVLVRGATMPSAEDLPEDLKDLAFRNAVELTHARWDSDVQLLAKALTPYVQMRPKPTPPEVVAEASRAFGRSRLRWIIILGVGLGLLSLLVGGYLWFGNPRRDNLSAAAVEQTNKQPSPDEPKNKPSPTPEGPKVRPSVTLSPLREVLRPLLTPKLLSPSDGTVFGHYPRTVTLAWERVPAAQGYKVEIQFQSGRWVPFGQVKDTDTTTHTFNFVGAQPGRWRVWAVNAEGREGPKSAWSGFSFTQ